MRVISVRFVKVVLNPSQIPPARYPEIAFIGRSNVGKSSALNCLAGQKIARTSKTPGRTHGLIFYLINGEQIWVDFPGFGYARQTKELRYQWQKISEFYLAYRPTLRCCLLIVDSRRPFTPMDNQMIEWLQSHQRPYVLVLTKADKLKRHERKKLEKSISTMKLPGMLRYFWFSSKTKEGRRELLSFINSILK